MLNNLSLIEKWQTPLHYQWKNLADQAKIGALNYSSGGALGFINLRGNIDDSDFTNAISEVLNCELPTEPKATTYAQRAAILWQSPDEWMLVCHYQTKSDLLEKLQQALKGVHAQVVDNSGGFMMMRIHGQEASTVLRHLSPYPILNLKNEECVQTIGKKTPFLICKIDNGDYALIFRRSFAEYLWKILEKTARPYGFALQKQWGFSQEDWKRYTD